MRHSILTLALTAMLVLCGCQKKEDETRPESETAPLLAVSSEPLRTLPLLEQPVTPRKTETIAEALVTWRKHKEHRPPLVLLSNDPFLQPLPQALSEKWTEVLTEGSDTELLRAVDFSASTPLIAPSMALKAALAGGLFSRVTWVLPIPDPQEGFSWEVVRGQLEEQGLPGASSLLETEGGLSGEVDGVPLRIVRLDQLRPQTGPVLLHLDLSYFARLYRHEIKTPIYPLLYSTLATLRQKDLEVADVTICPGNISGRLPLATRFLAEDLATLLSRPEMIGAPLPPTWEDRSQALYLENFMQNEKILAIYQALKERNPQDAATRFALYRVLRQLKRGEEALEELDHASRIDRAYGLEYLYLAPVALEKKNPQAALRMLKKATEIFPENPFVTLDLATLLLQLGHDDQALPLLKTLQALPWSEIYYPQMDEQLGHMITEAKEPPAQN